MLFVSASLTLFGGCGGSVMPLNGRDVTAGDVSSSSSAVIVGRVLTPSANGKMAVSARTTECPELVVTLDGAPATIVFEDDCTFVVTDVGPTESLELRIELPDQGISNTIELADVDEAELIEILVEATDESLTIFIERRTTPDGVDELPSVITENNVSIQVGAGVYEQDLTVLGNNFTLVGEASDDCDAVGWTVIEGSVLINGNNATFRNITFAGSVEVRGNNPRFINVCFGNELVVFGNNVQIED
jgi:hypothetical protein